MFGDLVEAGCDAIHAPLFDATWRKLAEKYRGRVTFWGEIDRKWLDPPATVHDIREAVLRVRRALDFGAGGVIAQCAWGPDTPIRSIAKFFEEWMVALPVGA